MIAVRMGEGGGSDILYLCYTILRSTLQSQFLVGVVCDIYYWGVYQTHRRIATAICRRSKRGFTQNDVERG